VRVLVTSTPGVGHINPVVPLASALCSGGHEVLWAVAQDGMDIVGQRGFEVVCAGMSVAERTESLRSDLPAIASLPPGERRAHLWNGFFVRAAAPVAAAHLVQICDDFQPELIVHEIGELGAAPVAMSRGIPHVTVAFSGALPDAMVAMTLEGMEPLWASFGADAPTTMTLFGDGYVHPFPASMGASPAVANLLRVRPVDPSPTNPDRPPWIERLGRKRPLIYVTSGTTPHVTTLAPWQEIFQALAELDVDALATVGPTLAFDDLGTVPDNVRVERFVPQSLVLQRAALVVSHAGAGTMLNTALAGVVQLSIPTFADQWQNAEAIAHAGAALTLDEGHRDSGSIANAVRSLLEDERFQRAARRLSSEIAQMPTPKDHVSFLEELAAKP
jgi:UDP:flavonoid glycosyltransferase YjiC (YdhE family)